MRSPSQHTIKKVNILRESQDNPNSIQTFSLEIAKYDGCSGYYLFVYDEDEKEIGDTYHDTIEEAMKQAYYECGVLDTDWEDVTNLRR